MLFNVSSFIYSLPILLFIILCLFFIYKENKVEKLFLIGFLVKILFAYFYAFAYQFYFKEGDTFLYFENALQLRKLFFQQPLIYLKILFLSPADFNPLFYQYFNFNEISYTNFEDTSEFLVSKISSIVMIFTGKSYLNVTLFFSTFNYIVSWNLFSIVREKLGIPNYILLPILLWPTLLFWASGINKEVIYVPCLYLIFRFLLILDFKLKEILLLVFVTFFLFLLKPFVFIVLIISLVLAYFLNRLKNIYGFLKLFSIIILIVIGGFYLFSDLLNYITLFQLAQESATSVAGGTGYSLATDLTSIRGFFLLLLDSFMVSLYRPYITEINNGITLLLAMESFLLLLLTLFVLYHFRQLRMAFVENKKILIFLFSFLFFLSIIFGAISFNYGTLMRFKIIITPFLFSLLLYIIYKFKAQHV